jgi:hypothetical protein
LFGLCAERLVCWLAAVAPCFGVGVRYALACSAQACGSKVGSSYALSLIAVLILVTLS